MDFNLIKKRIVNKYPQLGKWIKYKFDITWDDNEKDHVLGGEYDYEKIDLVSDGDWEKKLSKVLTELEFFELQHGKFLETMGCTGFGTLKGIQALAYVKYNQIWNKAERFTNKVSGTTKNGNSISRVFESIRKLYGVVDELIWGWDRNTFTWDKYYSNIPTDVLNKGKEWMGEWQFNYEVVDNNHKAIKEALKKSPVGVGVYAWYKNGDKYYSAGNANHWTLIIKQNWGKNYIILDSYAPYIKVLDWNFKFSFPRAFYLNINPNYVNKREEWLNKGKKFLVRSEIDAGAKGEWYKITKEGLEYVPKIEDIADDIADEIKESPENVKQAIKLLEKYGKILYVSEKDYKELSK